MSAVNKNKTKDEQQDMYREMMAPVNAANTNYGNHTEYPCKMYTFGMKWFDFIGSRSSFEMLL